MHLVCMPYFHLNDLFSELALSPNSNEVHVYGWMGSEARWLLLDKLREHVERVTGVDWAPVSNRIVTCGSVCHFDDLPIVHLLCVLVFCYTILSLSRLSLLVLSPE